MKSVEGYDVDRKALTVIGTDERVVFAARPSFATVHPGVHWDASTLLLTDRRLIITKDRLLGKARADFGVEWIVIRNVQGALWNGGGPQIQLLVHNAQTAQPVELIVQPQHAVDVESAIRAGYLNSVRADSD